MSQYTQQEWPLFAVPFRDHSFLHPDPPPSDPNLRSPVPHSVRIQSPPLVRVRPNPNPVAASPSPNLDRRQLWVQPCHSSRCTAWSPRLASTRSWRLTPGLAVVFSRVAE